MSNTTRRDFLRQGTQTMALAASLSACDVQRTVGGGFVGPDLALGHQWRDGHDLRASAGTQLAVPRQARTVIIGGGIAGLAAAWALRQRGDEDVVLLELENTAGGNSRGHLIRNQACPLGAHYLPVPLGEPEPASAATPSGLSAIRAALDNLGLMHFSMGRWQVTETGQRHLCHSPQERLFYRGTWQEGLLPVVDLSPATLLEYQRFAQLIAGFRETGQFTIPASAREPAPAALELDQSTFASWLTAKGFKDPQLLWYLDYCCRDDYGAGIDTVSAWAGIHYFASRHGFNAPGAMSSAQAQAESPGEVFTWPQGNAWLSEKLSAQMGPRMLGGRLVTHVEKQRQGYRILAQHGNTLESWDAAQCIVATPVFLAARLAARTDPMLTAALARLSASIPHASWAVLNALLSKPLQDRGGAAPAWDNVLYQSKALGYVNAQHQSLAQGESAGILTWYEAFGTGVAARRSLLERPWQQWIERISTDLIAAHPDFPGKLEHLDVARYGHAMAVPVPGRWQASTREARRTVMEGRPGIQFAHADLAGYSVFEEAFSLGVAAAHRVQPL